MTTAVRTRLRTETGTRPGRAAVGRVATTRGRAAAVLALGSAALHVVLAVSGELSADPMAGSSMAGWAMAGWAMAAMALVCLPCAVHLWRAPTGSVWAVTALVDLGMLALHAPMVVGDGTVGMHGTAGVHGMAEMHGAHGAGGSPVVMVAALVLVAGQLVLAASVGLTALLRR